MNNEFDYELTAVQWETLKALRAPAANPTRIRRSAVDSLVALGFVAMRGDSLMLTPLGRKILVRGSSQLLRDIAA
jgi:ribosomal protein S19E (S16A)